MPANVWTLFFAQALAMCAAPLMVFSGALASREIVESSIWATLPVAALVIGTACSVYPASYFSKILGRKTVFMTGMLIGCCASLLAMLSLQEQSFFGFVLSSTLMGVVVAVGQQFRFAAMESVSPDIMPKAAARLMVAGLISAWVGPELVPIGQSLLNDTFSGAFLLLAGLFILSFIIIASGFQNPAEIKISAELMPLHTSKLLQRQGFWIASASAAVGFGVMSFIMTATPISMHDMDHFSLTDTKWVIQSHITAMFLPSLFSGYLIQRLGHATMIVTGLMMLGICIIVGLIDRSFMHYWWALLILGVAWNFLFIAGTSLLPSTYNPDEKHQAQGLNDVLVFTTQASGALLSGVVLHWLGWNGLLLVTIPVILALLASVVYWRKQQST
ncbi:MFS transporter [Endozoicomonas sp. OPT23]|uniref:MFS transporter n=1 Tax=Endozoicomonas sp. OPT23 TaxID=2072845 RepID=UPI00129B25CC|nr:MFS transporter [Endozoicomonas sp. OPT23]MRI33284.1 MFS transporter [Endozoicomonas sp. OPT23]